MCATADQISRLRMQRNRAAAAAILFIVVSMAAVLPGFLRRHRQRVAAADEVVALQARIVARQTQVRAAEAELLRTENEIRSLLRQSH